jgi:alkylation response protein AidB-like acyl-CoA dehydrogenase
VDFELTDEQVELQRVVHDLVERDCPPSLVRSVVEGTGIDGDDRSTEVWKTLVQGEWPGLTVPVGHGGSGASAVELVIVLDELGRGADPSPFLATTSQYVPLVTESSIEAGPELLADVAAGGTGAGAYAADAVRAEPDGEAWRLTGTARTVLDGDRADQLAVVATTGERVGVFVVPASSVATTRTTSFDGSMHLADVTFAGTPVPSSHAGRGPDIAAAVERAHEWALMGLAASTTGACQRILEMTLDHVRNREQFGVVIGSFQAVKHMVVDMYVSIERARVLCQYAALTIAEDDPRREVAAAMAKAAAGDAHRLTARHGMQLFGGLGFTWENDLQIFVRRAKLGDQIFGSATQHRGHVARALLAGRS